MLDLISLIETAALGDIIKRVIGGAIDWAKNRPKPPRKKVKEKIEELVSKNLPDSIPAEKQEAVVSSLANLVTPTLDDILKYSPNTGRIYSAASKRTPAKKAVVKKAPAKKAAWKRAPVKKSIKKAAPRRK